MAVAAGDGVVDRRRSLRGIPRASDISRRERRIHGDQFGEVLAISRDGLTIAVGAPLESSQSTVINSGAADNSALESGAVYVFRRNGAWTQEAYIKAANAEAGDQFGWGVALSADGNTLVVGARDEDSDGDGVGPPYDNAAPNAGAAYVFVRTGSTWAQQAYLKATASDPSDQYGERVAISDDGNPWSSAPQARTAQRPASTTARSTTPPRTQAPHTSTRAWAASGPYRRT